MYVFAVCIRSSRIEEMNQRGKKGWSDFEVQGKARKKTLNLDIGNGKEV